LSSKLYRLIRPTLSVDMNSRKTVMIPAGELIVVVEEGAPDQRMLDVRWKDQVLLMFVEDVKRSEEIKSG
jgi:hypothetical protein